MTAGHACDGRCVCGCGAPLSWDEAAREHSCTSAGCPVWAAVERLKDELAGQVGDMQIAVYPPTASDVVRAVRGIIGARHGVGPEGVRLVRPSLEDGVLSFEGYEVWPRTLG